MRDKVADALGASSQGPQHPHAIFGRTVVDLLLGSVLPRNSQEMADVTNAAVMGVAGIGGTSIARPKAVNLPAWRGVAIDMQEVISRHTSTGQRDRKCNSRSVPIRQEGWGSRRPSSDPRTVERWNNRDLAESSDQDNRDGLPIEMTGTSQFSIRCDLTTLRRSAKGSITANVHAELGSLVCPNRNWSDFVVVILGWWLEASNRLVDGASAVDLQFMDGPYTIRANTATPVSCKLECLERAREPVILGSVMVDPLQLVKEIERVAADVLAACVARDWQSRDLDTLRSLLNRSVGRWRRP